MPKVDMGDVSLQIPDAWKTQSAVFSLTSADVGAGSGFNANIVLSRDRVAPGQTLSAYAADTLKKLREAGVPVKTDPAARRTIKLRDGNAALIVEHRVKGPGGHAIRQMQLVTFYGDDVLVLTASEVDGEPFEKLRPTLEAGLASVVCRAAPKKK